MEILSDVLEVLLGGFTETASQMGAGITAFVESIFLSTATDGGTTLSTFGVVVLVFSAIALSLGLFRLILNWIRGLGGARL